jgi:RES domain-containing protein
MIVYRLAKAVYSNDLSGKGAELSGGRWNSRGTPMIYTSQSRALCTAEIAVHTGLGILPVDFRLIQISIPDEIEIKQISSTELPADWAIFPPTHFTQKLGDKFISEKKYLVLQVPSAVIPGDWNYLINPLHLDISLIKIISVEEYNFDKRLFLK